MDSARIVISASDFTCYATGNVVEPARPDEKPLNHLQLRSNFVHSRRIGRVGIRSVGGSPVPDEIRCPSCCWYFLAVIANLLVQRAVGVTAG